MNKIPRLSPQFKNVIRATAIISYIIPLYAMAQPMVPGFDRSPNKSPADQITAGMVLINELNCIACHATNDKQSNRFETRSAPVLFTTHNSSSGSWLKRWLNEPNNLKPGTIMPDLLHGLDQQDKAHAINALCHYLVSLAPPLENQEVIIGELNKGKKLYQTIGCAQCHSPDGKDNGKDIPLGKLQLKYQQSQLIQFLLNPLHTRPAGRMPRIPTTKKEASHIAAFLLSHTPMIKDTMLAKSPSALKLRDEGKVLYKKLRCSNCHITRDSNILPTLSKPLAQLDLGKGCLSPKPPKAAPHFHLSAKQKKAITAALKSKPTKLTVKERAHHRMRQLNCTACHMRDGLGETNPLRDQYFTTTGNDLGDEGRIPPSLTGVGSKLTESALHKVLRGDDSIRPYMATRMPDFGETHAKFLVHNLSAADMRTNVKPTPREGEENKVGRNQYGRDLMGVKGLNCIACHQLGGHKSLGIQMTDLAHSPKRLQPEWFRDYLINPADFRPGTRMPSFWPGGKAVSPILGHNTERQIDSLWVYLNELEQTRLPDGLEKKGSFELKPDKRPIVFRTFLEGAGTHAIAIGFPEGIHAAFDSENVGWSLVWRRQFLDAESTWDDRFTPLTRPLGIDVRSFPSGPTITAALPDNKPWPKSGLDFRGYRLDKDGIPTMLYRHGKTEIADTLVPIKKELYRRIEFDSGKGMLWVRLAVANAFESNDAKVWSAANNLTIIAPQARVRTIGDRCELILPVKLNLNARTQIEAKYAW
jgi:mono/diheme cytochrome c family protein